MRFEARELTEYAEPVAAADLETERVYFGVQFLDEQMLIPIVEPFVFLGKNLRAGDVDRLYFQCFQSYSQGIRLESASEPDQYSFQVTSEEGINHIFEYERALDVLMMCALKRRQLDRTKKTP